MAFQPEGVGHTKAQVHEKVWQAEEKVRTNGHGSIEGTLSWSILLPYQNTSAWYFRKKTRLFGSQFWGLKVP